MNNEDRVPHWVPCPICNKMTEIKVFEDTVLLKFPLYCPKCKKETVINMVKLKMVRCE
ncbi:MAG: cysteine-rich KTR domain-containing protein [Faecousia sp.]